MARLETFYLIPFFSGQMSNETFKYTKEHRAQRISIKITCVSTAEIKEHVKILP